MESSKAIEFTVLASLVLAVLSMGSIVLGQSQLDRRILYQQAHTSYEQGNYEKAVEQYLKFLRRYRKGKHVYQARHDLLELLGGAKHDTGWLLKQEAVPVLVYAYKDSRRELIRDRAEWLLIMMGVRYLIEKKGKPNEENYPEFFSAFRTWWEAHVGEVKEVKGLRYYSRYYSHTAPITIDNAHEIKKIGEIRTASPLDAKVHWLFDPEAGAGTGAGIRSICFSPDGQSLAWSDYRGNLKIWSIKPGGKGRMIAAGSTISKHYGIERAEYGLMHNEFLAIDPDNKLLYSTLGLWEIPSGKPVREPWSDNHREELDWSIYIASFDPDGRLIVAGDGLSVWDVRHHKLLTILQKSLTAQGVYIDTMSLSRDGKILAAANAGARGLVKVWEMDSFREISRFNLEFVHALALSPDGKLLATSGHKPTPGAITLWDVRTGHQVAKFKDDVLEKGVDFLAFTPDGQMLVSNVNLSDDEARVSMFLDSWYNSRSSTVLWDVANRKLIWKLQRKVFKLCSESKLALSPDGHLIATADEELETIFLYGVPKQK